MRKTKCMLLNYMQKFKRMRYRSFCIERERGWGRQGGRRREKAIGKDGGRGTLSYEPKLGMSRDATLKRICVCVCVYIYFIYICVCVCVYIYLYIYFFNLSAGAQMVKSLPAMRETFVQSLGAKDPLEKEMATHSCILSWKIPQTEEHSRLWSIGSQRVRHD